ncbi:unnamed protein product [Allacma fusca]|uniref:Uncharacterized protein n=1 Tax=Allacma fusca TaxID=39272 RepID=A0A8J2KFA2_9HEXA|nr:unnamed protein product [Allacma fusca]
MLVYTECHLKRNNFQGTPFFVFSSLYLDEVILYQVFEGNKGFAVNMKKHLTYIFLFGILVNFSSTENTDSNIQQTTLVPVETSEEDDGPPGFVPHKLQDNNCRNTSDQLIHFTQTTNSTLTRLVEKLDHLEKNIEVMKSQISSLQSTNSKMTHALFKRNPEALVDLLPSPRNGDSFNGSTFEAISAAFPWENGLVVQIKNYLDVNLTGYQLYLPYGNVVAPAPKNISAKTTEVATFNTTLVVDNATQAEISYRIGGTNISLHVFFTDGEYQTVAAAFLPMSAPARSILSLDCIEYKHRGTPGSHKCITNVIQDNEQASRTEIYVYERDLFMTVTYEVKFSPRIGTVTCEVFKLTI